MSCIIFLKVYSNIYLPAWFCEVLRQTYNFIPNLTFPPPSDTGKSIYLPESEGSGRVEKSGLVGLRRVETDLPESEGSGRVKKRSRSFWNGFTM